MKPEKNNTFCYYPFYQLALKDWNSNGIKSAAPCCNAIRPENPDPLRNKLAIENDQPLPSEIFHGREMSELREALCNGKQHPACSTCWNMEEDGSGHSFRMHSQPQFDIELDQIINEPELVAIDLIMGEHCNLRCRMCGPGLSNSLRIDYREFVENNIDTSQIPGFDWISEQREYEQADSSNEKLETLWNKNYLDPDARKKSWRWVTEGNAQWQEILDNIHSIKHIKATGGETTITKDWLNFIDYAIETGASKNITLEFHTNATKFTDRLISKFSEFERVYINLSIDSVNKNYEYVRYPMTWSALNTSLNRLLDKIDVLDTVALSMNPVISILNVFELPEIIQFWKNAICEKNNDNSLFAIEVYPEKRGISLKHLMPETKTQLIHDLHKLQNTHDDVNVQSVITALTRWKDYTPTRADQERLYNEISAFDQIRNQSYRNYCHPDMIKYIDFIQETYYNNRNNGEI